MKLFKKALRKPATSMPSQTTEAAPLPKTVTPQQAAPVTLAKDTPLRVILFIGHHKVGSTSLQDYLSRNAVALSGAGILYPYVDFEGLAHFTARANGHDPSPESLPINVREPHNALAFRMLAAEQGGTVPAYHRRLPALPQMFNAMKQQIRFSQPHTVILTAEVFANFNAVSPKLIQNLVTQFPNADFTLVATLRRIDEYIASWQGQRLKFGHKLEPLRETGLDSYLKGIHFNYRLMVEGWIKALPEANVILRDYAQVRAAGGSVVDFITQTGLDLPEGLAPERRENDSFHRAVYEIARQGNQQLSAAKAGVLRRCLREKTAELQLPSSHDIELFGARNRARMLEKFRPIDRYLGEVMGRSGFFADLEQVPDCAPLAELDAYQKALAQICATPKWCDDQGVTEFLAQL